MRKQILVVDDEEWFRNALKNSLENAGYHVTTAENGQVAKSLAVLDHVDAVISDIRMAPGNGIELLHFLRRTRPNLPVILMTGFAELTETQDAFSMGAAGFLAKPFKHEELTELLKTLGQEGEQKAIPNESLDADYCKIMIDDFVSGKEMRFDIHVRLSESKYVKVAHEGENIDIDRIRAYKSRGISHLYMKKTDFRSYVGFNVNLVKLASKSSKITAQKKLHLVRHTGEALLEYLHTSVMDQESVDYAKTTIDNTVSVLGDSDDALGLLNVLNDHADFLYAHSVAVSFVAVLAVREMDWTSHSTAVKIAMCGMFHDIGKKEIPRSVLDKPRKEMNAEEVRLIESHPTRGVELLGQMSGFSNDVLQVILQHHENCAGSGYPYRLTRTKIHPFARLIGVVDKFVNMTMKTPNNQEVSPAEALNQMATFYAREFDPVFVAALARVFKVRLLLNPGKME